MSSATLSPLRQDQFVRLAKVRLQNTTCFDDLTLDLTVGGEGGSALPASWVVLLGENSTGKSTLLQMVSLALLGTQNSIRLVGSFDWSQYIRSTTQTESFPSNISSAQTSCVIITSSKETNFSSQKSQDFKIQGTWIDFQHSFDSLSTDFFYCGYGSRRQNSSALSTMSSSYGNPSFDKSSSFYGFSTLFGSSEQLISIDEWLSKLYSDINFPNVPLDIKEKSAQQYDKAITAIRQIFPAIEEVQVSSDKRVSFRVLGSQVTLAQLSDGYRSMIAWCIDLMARLFHAFPESAEPLKEHGIVLVDEIDAHLHPRWQRTVVETIRTVFPNIQFIVTSHSPFIAQDMRETDKIIILERSGDDKNGPVVAREETGSFYNWSADQILSAFFGLSEGTQGNKALEETKQYEQLLDTKATKTLTTDQNKQFAALTEKLESAPLGDTPEEQELFDAADLVLEALKNRRARRK